MPFYMPLAQRLGVDPSASRNWCLSRCPLATSASERNDLERETSDRQMTANPRYPRLLPAPQLLRCVCHPAMASAALRARSASAILLQ
jgi:hypothetical protein